MDRGQQKIRNCRTVQAHRLGARAHPSVALLVDSLAVTSIGDAAKASLAVLAKLKVTWLGTRACKTTQYDMVALTPHDLVMLIHKLPASTKTSYTDGFAMFTHATSTHVDPLSTTLQMLASLGLD